MREQVHCHGATSRCCLSTPQASSFALPPSNASGRLGRTLYWLSHHVEHFDESQQALSQRDRRPLTWKAVQNWGRLWWKFCPIWNAGTSLDMAYGLNNPLRKPVATSEKSPLKFLPIWNRIWRKGVAPQDPSFFNLQKIAEGTKHAFIQARVARWLINMVRWC